MALARAWTVVADGRLSAAEQAKLWGLREALKMTGEDSGQWQSMADRVSVGGGGHPLGPASPGHCSFPLFSFLPCHLASPPLPFVLFDYHVFEVSSIRFEASHYVTAELHRSLSYIFV